MQEGHRIKKYILLFAVIILIAITILFFAGEKMLAFGWYYIPGSALKIVSVLCLLWQVVLVIVVCALSKRFILGVYSLFEELNMPLGGWLKNIIRVITVAAAAFLVLFLFMIWLSYSAGFSKKVEQYDEHIALYVSKPFERAKFWELYYRYEENWLLMRIMSNDELEEAILKYGDPNDYDY